MAQILLDECPAWGVRIERRGDQLAVIPKGRAPGELLDLLRANKEEILNLLEAKADGLAQDCAPWLHVAKQVIAGEFDAADGSTRESLLIGLRSIGHPVCQKAFDRLNLTTK